MEMKYSGMKMLFDSHSPSFPLADVQVKGVLSMIKQEPKTAALPTRSYNLDDVTIDVMLSSSCRTRRTSTKSNGQEATRGLCIALAPVSRK